MAKSALVPELRGAATRNSQDQGALRAEAGDTVAAGPNDLALDARQALKLPAFLADDQPGHAFRETLLPCHSATA
jgi:hypothetical protein